MLLPTNGPTAASRCMPSRKSVGSRATDRTPYRAIAARRRKKKLININSSNGSKDENEITLAGVEKEREISRMNGRECAVTIGGGGGGITQRGANDQKGFERKRNNNNNNKKRVACCRVE